MSSGFAVGSAIEDLIQRSKEGGRWGRGTSFLNFFPAITEGWLCSSVEVLTLSRQNNSATLFSTLVSGTTWSPHTFGLMRHKPCIAKLSLVVSPTPPHWVMTTLWVVLDWGCRQFLVGTLADKDISGSFPVEHSDNSSLSPNIPWPLPFNLLLISPQLGIGVST